MPASRALVDSTPPLKVSLLAGTAKKPPLLPRMMTTATEPLPLVRICWTVPTAVPLDIRVMPVVRPARVPLVTEVVVRVPGNIRSRLALEVVPPAPESTLLELAWAMPVGDALAGPRLLIRDASRVVTPML